MWFYNTKDDRDMAFIKKIRSDIDKVLSELPQRSNIDYLFYIQNDYSVQAVKRDLDVMYDNLLKIQNLIIELQNEYADLVEHCNSQNSVSKLKQSQDNQTIMDLKEKFEIYKKEYQENEVIHKNIENEKIEILLNNLKVLEDKNKINEECILKLIYENENLKNQNLKMKIENEKLQEIVLNKENEVEIIKDEKKKLIKRIKSKDHSEITEEKKSNSMKSDGKLFSNHEYIELFELYKEEIIYLKEQYNVLYHMDKN